MTRPQDPNESESLHLPPTSCAPPFSQQRENANLTTGRDRFNVAKFADDLKLDAEIVALTAALCAEPLRRP